MKYNTDIFIKNAKEIHGDKYDYSKTIYNKATELTTITCKIHGDFYQQPRLHLRGEGCPICAQTNKNNYKSTKNYFLERVYGKYNNIDYSKVIYTSCNEPTCFICKQMDKNGIEHGEFWQTPHSHLYSKGCPKCKIDKIKESKNNKIKIDNKTFIEKAKEIHGDKYDYSKVNYINDKTKVCIICQKHGEFWQMAGSHLAGKGCNKCSKNVYDTKSFIEKAKEIHGDKYDYSKVNYINSKTKVCIICPKHGEFWILPTNFNKTKNIRECPKCQIEKRNLLHTNNTNIFIEKAKEIHGDKYDYSKVNYINSKTKVCIICPKHGEFWQTPNKHLNGEGCPKCKISHLENDVMEILNKNNINYIHEYTPKWSYKKRYDFCIENKKIIIECQGEQHYKPVDFANKGIKYANKEFIKTQKRDRLKRKYAIDNGYSIIYYTDLPYTKFDEIKDLNKLIQIINDI